ncbi:hypothetical protein BGZ96_007444 [Linnemannia gamsii]|uniref:DUF676 domain-containing protein n=1 Tax=Linnemannia gamsii TaxID=64522 RepID=A0ABQ7K089_9FUNG|nr:hypothetical protein BGZ96_007444 [Linnemannia gamsii]
MLPPPNATLLLLFIHGFKGHDHHTFLDFPTRIMTIFTNAKANLDVESIVYPQYDTRGDFNAAVKTFAEWTQEQVKSRQEFNERVYKKLEENGQSSGKIPPVYVCFLGHSMGGLVAGDTALYLEKLPEKSPVIGILAFDTPYYGLNHSIFTQAAYERAAGLAQKATGAYSLVSAAYLPAAAAWSSMSGSNAGAAGAAGAAVTGHDSNTRTVTKTEKKEQKPASGGWGWGSIALGIGAAVAATGAAVVINKHMNDGMQYVTSHIQFVGILWNSLQLKQRVDDILRLPIGFHCFYTRVRIPASSTNNWSSGSRTFIELKSISDATEPFFSARECSGQDEIEAHMEMFNPAKNFDYYPMGEETVKRVRVMVDEALKRES